MGWALPIDQYAIEPLYSGSGPHGLQNPAMFGVYRRNKYGWYRITQRISRESAQVKLYQLKTKSKLAELRPNQHVQASDTTRPDEA